VVELCSKSWGPIGGVCFCAKLCVMGAAELFQEESGGVLILCRGASGGGEGYVCTKPKKSSGGDLSDFAGFP